MNVEQLELTHPDVPVRTLGKELHSLLMRVTDGVPNSIVDQTPGDGFNAWRKLLREYAGVTAEGK